MAEGRWVRCSCSESSSNYSFQLSVLVGSHWSRFKMKTPHRRIKYTILCLSHWLYQKMDEGKKTKFSQNILIAPWWLVMNPARAGIANGTRAEVKDGHTLPIRVTICSRVCSNLKMWRPIIQTDESRISCRSLFTGFAFRHYPLHKRG